MMSGFKAENIESDEELEEPIDDTREIQIEDALKLYQNALKLHAQGSEYLGETRDAYEELFKSEVFKYPEALGEYAREEKLGVQVLGGVISQKDATKAAAELEAAAALPPVAGVGEDASSTLPNLLYLSYKNRALFKLSAIQKELKQAGSTLSDEDRKQLTQQVASVLEDLGEALDKDEGDADTWRHAARVCESMGSIRLARFCLEAALEDDGEGTDQLVGLRSFEAEIIGNNLRKLEEDIEDDIAVPILQEDFGGDKSLSVDVLNAMGLHTYLPEIHTFDRKPAVEAGRHVVTLPESSWSAAGEALIGLLQDPKGLPPGTAIGFEAPQFMNIDVEQLNTTEKSQPTAAIAASHAYDADVDGGTTLPAISISGEQKQESNGSSDEKVKDEEAVTSSKEDMSAQENGLLKQGGPPSRKRSSADAELPETAEGGRARSKRIRARGSLIAESILAEAQEAESPQDGRLEELKKADIWLFEVLHGVLTKLDVTTFAHGDRLRAAIVEDKVEDTDAIQKPMQNALKTIYKALMAWSEEKTVLLIQPRAENQSSDAMSGGGLTAFLESSKGPTQTAATTNLLEGSVELIEEINSNVFTAEEAALKWLCGLVYVKDENSTFRYLESAWSDSLKQSVIQLLVAVDERLYETLLTIVDVQRGTHTDDLKLTPLDVSTFASVCQTIQTLFELHLDEYSRIVDRASTANKVHKSSQQARLDKWAGLSREALRFKTSKQNDESPRDSLVLRHLWATVLHMEVSANTPRAHILSCFGDLKAQLQLGEDLEIFLPNSASMPELSAQAADREISRLETMDFFLNVFTQADESPVELIERLEPILMPTSSFSEEIEAVPESDDSLPTTKQRRGSNFAVLSRFLAKTSSHLRLSLWRKLLDAYRSIDYKPKIFSIQLKMLELIMAEIQNPHEDQTKDEKEAAILVWLNQLSQLVLSTFDLARDIPNALECIDLDHLKSSTKVLSEMYLLLYPISLYDDHNMLTSKAAQPTNPFRKYPKEALHNAMKHLHDLQMKVAVLLDKMFVEAVSQMPEAFQGPHFESGLEYRLEYLRHVHYAYGLRRLCKTSDSLFLKYHKSMLEGVREPQKATSNDLSQILLDLYDLNCFSSQQDKQDHGCDSDYLNYPSALELLDFVLDKAHKTNIKDLLKSEMSKAIEKLNTALGLVKPGQTTQRNRKICHEYLRSPINPLSIYRALRGIGDLPTTYVKPDDAIVAAKGWYFLQGQLAMGKYRAARLKNAPGDMDDLKTALDYFSQDLEYSTDHWETWYNLAQTNDALIEEEVLWTAEKLNTSRGDLLWGQRASIHAYEMALATALRTASSSAEVMDKMANLCGDFGLRVYASSREPFSMQPFSLSDFAPRHFSSAESTGGIYQRRQFHSMKPFDAWKLAAALFEQAIRQRPKRWINHYLRGKCLWKMSRKPTNPFRHQRYKSALECTVAAIQSFQSAVELLPKRKESSKGEPTLEPIYKLVSVMHKLVREHKTDGPLAEEKITEMLNTQNQFEVPRIPKLSDFSDWSDYVLDVLKIIRAADKAHWHHRLVFRAAGIMYSKNKDDPNRAKIVKEYLQEQKVYSSKTLALSVWKPDNERAGRHWVYMTRYARFLAEIFEQTDDLEAIELLAKRIRKKISDFCDHAALWEEVSTRHLRMHRKHGNIQPHIDEAVFRNMQQDEFVAKAAPIDEWAQAPSTSHPLRDILAEVAELKKMNAGLAKPNPFDDLLAETYATIWSQILPTFDPPVVWPPPDRQGVTRPSEASRAATPVPDVSPRRNVMSLTNLINADGGDESKSGPAPGALHFIQQNAPSRPSSAAPTEVGGPIKRSRIISRREYLKRANEATWSKTKEGAGLGRGRRASVDREASSSGVVRFGTDEGFNNDSKSVLTVNTKKRSIQGDGTNSESSAAHKRRSTSKLLGDAGEDGKDAADGAKRDSTILDDSDSSLSELQSEPEEPSQLAQDQDGLEGEPDDNHEDGAGDEEHDEEAQEHEEDGDQGNEAEDDGDDEAGYGNSDDEDEQFATPMAGSRTPNDENEDGHVAPSTTKKHGPVTSWGLATPTVAENKTPEQQNEHEASPIKDEDKNGDVEMQDAS